MQANFMFISKDTKHQNIYVPRLYKQTAYLSKFLLKICM